MENKEINKKLIEETAIQMINDYLYYGYGIKTWLKQDYKITKILGVKKIKELFNQQVEKLGNMER